MREIKFRGLDVMTGDWVYGSHVQTGLGMHYIIPQNLIADAIPQSKVDNTTVGQFTGLKDKNGREGFIGDIANYQRIQYTDCSRSEIEEISPPVIGELYYADGIWLGLRKNDGTGIIFMPGMVSGNECNEELEIIGNIYENPDLLNS
ncbi:YopX family protein [Neobacillus sp. WH10]|uniref:YopX family protein n=1 Tax=Neobacillus sp. WH10 TaxID=3047873 RepID=UPI0024C1AA80|nr:YopX family protein [Neobacillus sp. WH10]WHY76252.1 YopX family protein [Neobacillus sp. WH10]